MAVKATQMEDFGLQAILEKMNSLITLLISGPFWDTSNIYQKCLIFSQSSFLQKNSIESDFRMRELVLPVELCLSHGRVRI